MLDDLFAGKHILWQCFFGSYCLGLDEVLPIRGVSCMDHGVDYDQIEAQLGIQLLEYEQPGVRRFNWIGCGIEVVFERCRDQIGAVLDARPREDWIVTSTPASEQLERFCETRSLRYVGTPAHVAEPFKPKRRLHEALAALGLPRVEGRWLRLAGADLSQLQAELGAEFFAQTDLGAAGSGTRMIQDHASLLAAAESFGDDPVFAAPCLGELSLNINAAVVAGRAFSGCPNVQLAGVDQLGAPCGGYAGNDYSAAATLDPAIAHDAVEQTVAIGEWMAAQGFEGLYGLDFVIGARDGRCHAVDLNPRWQGSTHLSVQAELASGRLPLVVAEFAYRCGLLDLEELEHRRDQFTQPVEAAQLCLRAPSARLCRVPEQVRPGVYRSTAASFCRDGLRLTDCRDQEEWLLTCGVPRQGTLVEPGALLVRVSSTRSVVGERSDQLGAWAGGVVDSVYRMFGMQLA